MSTERDNYKAIEHELNPEALKEAAEQGRERIAEQLERRSPERTIEKSTIELSKEARERAAISEKQSSNTEKAATHERKNTSPTTKAKRDKAFSEVMTQARSHMSPASRTFSKVIHNPAVEKTSEVVGSTIARPNAIMSGSISAFIVVLGVFLIAKYYGYPLSGTETIVAFALGWLIGIAYDFLRAMITGGRQ